MAVEHKIRHQCNMEPRNCFAIILRPLHPGISSARLTEASEREKREKSRWGGARYLIIAAKGRKKEQQTVFIPVHPDDNDRDYGDTKYTDGNQGEAQRIRPF